MARKISIIVPDVASNVLGAATVLARHLQADFEVEIIGPDLGHGVNPMYAASFDYKIVSVPGIYRYPTYWSERRKLMDAVTGDTVIAVKAYADTVPVALELKRTRGCRAVVYLDEWDGAYFASKSLFERVAGRLKTFHRTMGLPQFAKIERMIPNADLVISTTTFLQKKFGGEVVPMGIDTEWFKPQSPDSTNALKASYGLSGHKLVVFGGVVRPHKGVELILDALALQQAKGWKLVIVGPANSHVKELQRNPKYAPFLISLGPQPKEKMPQFLDLADLMIIPLMNDPLAQSQMPCKIYEAMSMAKPVITSAVSDLPAVMQGCGIVVPPENAAVLAQAVESVANDLARWTAMGVAAREKCIREYGADVTRKRLQSLMTALP